MQNQQTNAWYKCVSILLLFSFVTVSDPSLTSKDLRKSSFSKSKSSSSTVAVKAASQTFSTINELARELSVASARSELRTTPSNSQVLFPDEMTLDHISAVGSKSAVLAAFVRFLAGKGFSINVPKWFSMTYEWVEKIMHRGLVTDADRSLLANSLKKLSEKGDQFGDRDNPFLVSLRAANLRVFPGRFITILNIGIHDDNIAAVAKRLESEELAWELYAKLIRDFAIAGDAISEQDFDAAIRTKRKSTKLKTLQEIVKLSKATFKRAYGQDFYQDPMEQLAQAIFLIAPANRHGINSPTAFNSIMVQRMVFGNRENSLSGNIFSRDPVTGAKTLDGAIGFGVQGDDLLDAKGFDEFKISHPDLVTKLESISRHAEEFLKDIGSIEFTVEHGHFYLLQLRPATKSPLAMVQAYADMVEEGVLSKQQAIDMLKGIDLEALKFEPISEESMPKDAILLGQGRSVGVQRIFTGLAALSHEDAIKLRKEGHPVIYVRSVITANDERAIQHSRAVIASRELGNHAQSIALRYGVGAIVDVGQDVARDGEKLEVDDRSGKASITDASGARHEIIAGETVLMVDATGKIYLRKATKSELNRELLSRRRKYLPKALVEILRWQIEAQGKRADFIVDAYGHGERVAWADIGRNVRVDSKDFDIFKDIVRPHNNTAVLVGVRDVIESDLPLEVKAEVPKPEIREIELSKVEQFIGGFVYVDSIETFTYELWHRYDNLGRLLAQSSGFTQWDYGSKIVYSNLNEAEAYFMRRVAELARQKFIQAVVHGVDRHKMTAFIFRSNVVKYFDAAFVRSFLVDVIHYAAQEGYSGDARGHDWQIARLFATVIKGNQALGSSILNQLNQSGMEILLHELKIFYIDVGLYAKSGDTDFAPPSELADVLEAAKPVIVNAKLDYRERFEVGDIDELIRLFRTSTRSELRKPSLVATAAAGILSLNAAALNPAPQLFNAAVSPIHQASVHASLVSSADQANVLSSLGLITAADTNHSAQHAYVMTGKLAFDESVVLVAGPLAQKLGTIVVVASTRSEMRIIEEVNHTYGTRIIAVSDYRAARSALRRLGITSITVAASANDSTSLLSQYFNQIEIWGKDKLDSLFSLYRVTKSLIQQFQARLAVLIAA